MIFSTESKIRLVAHNLGLGTQVSGTESLEQKFVTLGEGMALMLEHPKRDGMVRVSFMDDDHVITAYELTRATDDSIKITKTQ
jgi:hypothetical protein